MDDKYRLEKFQSESDEDFVGRLLFQLVNLKKQSNAHLGFLSQEEKKKDKENGQYRDAIYDQGEKANEILEEIKKVVAEKEIDLSEVVNGLSKVDASIKKGSSGVIDRMDTLPFEIPETKKILLELVESVKDNKPSEVVLDGVIEAQKKSTSIIGEMLSKLTGEVKKKVYPTKMSIDGPVDVLKPKWWSEFKFSWEPLKDIIEKAKAHTFSVKVENQFKFDEKIFKNLPEDVAKKLSAVLAESLPKIRISGGGGGNNPFTFAPGGAVKVFNENSSEGGATEATLLEIKAQGAVSSAIYDGRKTVASAGTAEALASVSTPCSKVVITAFIANQGDVVIGSSTVVASSATRRGIPLMAGGSIEIPIDDLAKIFIDSEQNDDGITFIHF